MDLYPDNISAKLGFDRVQDALKSLCQSIPGKDLIDQMTLTTDYGRLSERLSRADEFLNILEQGLDFPTLGFLDIRESLKIAEVPGAVLELEALVDIRITLRIAEEVLRFLNSNHETFPALYALSSEVMIEKSLVRDLDRVLDDDGKVKDSASPALRKIRQGLIQKEQQVRKKLSGVFQSASEQKMVPDGASLTVRSGRLVMPLQSEYKRRIKGFVHDVSSSGQTVFIEPEEVLDLNNERRELELQEKQEIYRILSELTSTIGAYAQVLMGVPGFLARMDRIRAVAVFARQTSSIRPELEAHPCLDWKQARHPILERSLKSQGKEIVPLDVALTPEERLLLISGPNAGGKSVTLKTVGLLQMMLQSGMLIPLGEGSAAGIFKEIFIDIGDEQSIDNDLSTYSSHLTNMRYFLHHSTPESLILIDEFGTGTDPEFGGAIAEAVLAGLLERRPFGLITTHYGNLKQYAEKSEGVANASMLFDVEHLQPLYQLSMGKPGSSFALEIAQKIGLPSGTLENAKDILGRDKVDLEVLLSSLEAEKSSVEQRLRELKAREASLKNTRNQFDQLNQDLKEKKRIILEEARTEARNILKEANARIERTIREIREKQAEKEATKAVREELKEFEKEVHKQPKRPRKPKRSAEKPAVVQGSIGEGDQVRIKGQESTGKVIRLQDKSAEVMFGDLRSTIKLNRLEKVSGAANSGKKKPKQVVRGMNLNQRMAEFKPEIDLRGTRAEEAIVSVEQFIDNAILFNVNSLRIIHGKGNGILREMVRNVLKQYNEVEKVNDAHPDFGGTGVTEVRMK